MIPTALITKASFLALRSCRSIEQRLLFSKLQLTTFCCSPCIPLQQLTSFCVIYFSESAQNETNYFNKPEHHFWPFVPINSSNDTYFKTPTHNFWPFIPVAPVDEGVAPVTPAAPVPSLPGPAKGNAHFGTFEKKIVV